MRLLSSPDEVQTAVDRVTELGSLVDPGDKARAVAGGCAMKIIAALGAMTSFVFSMATGFLVLDYAPWWVALPVGVLAMSLSLLVPVGVANTGIRWLYERAARNAMSTPRLGSVSSGSSTAIPSIESARGHE